MANGIFGKYPPAAWEVPGAKKIVFPVERIKELYSNRIVAHSRLYRDGARCDDTGGAPTGWELTIGWYNSADHEEGVDGLLLYPDLLNTFCAACKIHKTGTLTVPTVGPRRCRAHEYERVEVYDDVDASAMVVQFLEDNEDDAGVAAFRAPSASSVAKRYALEALDASQLHGAHDDDLGSLLSLASDLEDLARAPAEFVADLEARAGNIAHAVERVGRTFGEQHQAAQEEARALLTDPTSSRAHRSLERLRDSVHSAVADAHAHNGRPVSHTFDRPMSIFTVASIFKLDPTKVIPLNQHIEDLLNIRPGTAIRVPES